MGKAQDQATVTDQVWSIWMADSAMARYAMSAARWHYEHGFLLKSIERVWRKTGQAKYGRFIRAFIDAFVEPDGAIRAYRVEEYNLDQINAGRMLFPVYRETGDARYKKAIDLLRSQLKGQPRTPSGGFWHKQIYPNQMWLDGIYMASPFYAEFAASFNELAGFDDVVHQIRLIEEHTRDPRTGLMYHAWDESKQQRWADPATGRSPHVWGRAMGWYAMALVDVLDYWPADHASRSDIIASLERLARAVTNIQEPSSGVWYQVLDQGRRAGNYLEASASCMFVYALAKAVRKGYLPDDYLAVARRGYHGILTRFIALDDAGAVNLTGICGVAGLGGNPYRDGSYQYYIGEPVVTNDLKGVAAFILAAAEIEDSQGGGIHRSQSAR